MINAKEELLEALQRNGSWLERREYDGAEWWKFMIPPTKESIENYINTLYI